MNVSPLKRVSSYVTGIMIASIYQLMNSPWIKQYFINLLIQYRANMSDTEGDNGIETIRLSEGGKENI